MRRKGSGSDFIVKAIIHNDHILSIILFITFPTIWVSSAPCSQFIGIVQKIQLSDCLCQLTDLLHLTFCVFAQLGANRSEGLLQKFCSSTEHCLIAFNDISGCHRIRGGKTALERRQRGFSGIPSELTRNADAVDFVTKLAYYKQGASKHEMLRQMFQILMKFTSKTFPK